MNDKLVVNFLPVSISVEASKVELEITADTANLEFTSDKQIAREYTDRDPYEGPYQVAPGQDDNVIHTDGLRMTDDLVVQKVPYAAVSNESGGYTVTIL